MDAPAHNPPGATPRFRLTRRQRLSGDRAFAAVHAQRVRAGSGPLLVYGRPNDLSHSRIGLSVSRRVGRAVRRNRVKRLIREAFRLAQHELPTGFDFVIVARPHDDLPLARYQDALRECISTIVRRWPNPPSIAPPEEAPHHREFPPVR